MLQAKWNGMASAPHREPVALITGTSSGFGLWMAIGLAVRGYRVVATMRNPDAGGELRKEAASAGVTERLDIRPLDVTDEASIAAAVDGLLTDYGRVDVLVNNAGYALGGFVEELPTAAWRAQMETNFFGLVAVTRAVLPVMRERRAGTIVNIGSVSGQIGFPGFGAYAASKFAVEGFSESLRHEMLPFGVRVVLIQAAPYRTSIWRKGWELLDRRPGSPYAQRMDAILRYTRRAAETAPDPRDAAERIVRLIGRDKLRLRYPIGPNARLTLLGKTLLPWRLLEKLVRRGLR